MKFCRCIVREYKLTVKVIWFFGIFYIILKAILCVQHFCSFGAMLHIVNLLKKLISLLFVFLVCLVVMNEIS